MSDFPAALIRPDLRGFGGYSSARTSAPATGDADTIWLNANEAGTPSRADPGGTVRRYPDPQPPALVEALAAHYRVPHETLVVGRGSDEAIELLVRTACRPGADGIVISSPTFGMYAVSARLHGVPVHDLPQRDRGSSWEVDTDAVAQLARDRQARIVFLATPGNPTGSAVPESGLIRLAAALADQALVVVDEAYQEFGGAPSATALLEKHPNLVVLRTLSKAHALAAARVGVAIAHPDLAAVLRRVQAPYPVPVPVTALALQALEPHALADTESRIAATLAQRDRLTGLLAASPLVRAVYDSRANFVLARCADQVAADTLLARLAGCGIVVRDLRALPGLADAVRVTAGSTAEIDALQAALSNPTAHSSTTPPVRTA